MLAVVCDDEKNIEYKDGDQVFVIDITTSTALFDSSGCVARCRLGHKQFGRIGHTKNYAIDRAIQALESLKDKDES